MIRGFFLVLLLIRGVTAEAVIPNGAPVNPNGAPVNPNGAPVIPNGAPVIPNAGPVIPNAGPVVDPRPAPWKTLSGNAPLVIARGGYSGLFPESSSMANQFAVTTSMPGVAVYCNLQLAKDGAGLCKSELKLDNSTNIADMYPQGQKTYTVNGQPITGWFAVDYTLDELNNVTLIQSTFTRPSVFDLMQQIPMVGDVVSTNPPPPAFWLNVQYDSFYKEHKLDVVAFISEASKQIGFNFISSPEISLLKDIGGIFKRGKTKLIFRFLEQNAIEPSTNSTYSALLKDLNNIKTFASAILVPKNYIWPVGPDLYLGPASTLVTDAHKLGLEVYAAGFANDFPASYNYSYDPVAEYLQFVDSAEFSVDGVLTDFPSTASEAIACFAHNKNAPPKKKNPLIITHNGASGVFAGSTDLAYQKAVEDGADIIDCSVQMSKDGVPFCLESADLMGATTAMTSFMSRSSMVPEIQKAKSIFSFDLTWSEIQSLKPQLVSPLFHEFGLVRNPAAKNQGKLMTLPEFLDFAKNSTLQGVLINIENAAYLASQKGLGVVDTVSSALTNASYDKVANQQVFIQSDDTSVLSAFKNNLSYKRVLNIEEAISDVPKPSVDEIKKYADAVNVMRSSIMKSTDSFITSSYNVVDEMHAANISVYVSIFRNEFMTVAFDFFADPIMELSSFIVDQEVDGIVTEFPATASAYLRSPCADPDAKLPYTILPAEPGGLLDIIPQGVLSPAQAPAPVLDASKVLDPPLPPVTDRHLPPETPAPSDSNSGCRQVANAMNAVLCLFMAMLSLLYLSRQ